MSSQQHSVLIAEDEESIRNLLIKEFELAGFKVLKAVDGEEAISVALNMKPDAIVLDILMPKKDGLDVLEELRADDWGKNAVVVLLTNVDTNQEVLKKVEALKPAFYLIKTNIQIKEVVSKVRETLAS